MENRTREDVSGQEAAGTSFFNVTETERKHFRNKGLLQYHHQKKREVGKNEKEYICGDDHGNRWRRSVRAGDVYGADYRVECISTRRYHGSRRACGAGFDGNRVENKEPIKVSGKTIGATLIGFVGALMLGIGMCLTMVWSSMIVGIIVGLIGIVVLLCLIPFAKGLR